MTAPKTIGGYTVLARLGQGGMAEVLLALKPGPAGFRKLLVVKQLRKELVTDEEYLTMFLDEARLAARLSHTNVVRTYEVGEHEDGYYIAMDYLEGQPFGRVLRRAAHLPLEARIRILSEVLAGLHYAHEVCDFDGSPLNVIHRDVSPHNVFITYNGGVQLLDFGIAKAAGAASQTREGTFKGKVAYIAPEQALGETLDRRADIFSVGVMLWEAVVLRRLSRGEQDIVRLKKRIEGTEPRLREVVPDADPILLDACDKAMAQDPDGRFQTAAEFQKALQPFLNKSMPTPQQLGSWMTQTFAQDRQALADEIEGQIRRHEQTHSTEIPILDVGAVSRTPLTGSIPAREEDGNRMRMVGLVVVGALVFGAFLAFRSPTPTDTPPLAAAPETERAATELAATELSETTVPVPEPEQPTPQSFDFSVEANPAHATIFLDGVEVGSNPHLSTVVADGEEHQLRIAAAGYRDHAQTVRFDRDRHLGVSLVRVGVSMVRARMRPTMVAIEPEPTTTEVAMEPTMQATQTAEPTMTPTPMDMQPRPIDITDPY